MGVRDENRIQSEWLGARGYFNTAAVGLPPQAVVDAMLRWLLEWQSGQATYTDWLPSTDHARSTFADIIGVDRATVATGATVSQLIGLVAASLPAGSRVVIADDEFASLYSPFEAQVDRGVRIEVWPRSRLLESVESGPTAVAFSLVASDTGEVANYRDLAVAAAASGAMTIVDAAQACGWLDVRYSDFDVVVCPAFKWLMSPRGSAFMYVRPERLAEIRPSSAGWYSASDGSSGYGASVPRIDARRLDISPVWTSWVGTAIALEIVKEISVAEIGAHDVSLANRLRVGLDLSPSFSPIVVMPDGDYAGCVADAGMLASTPRGRLRLSVHWYNTSDESIEW
jgi:selenocysteine lyase/cysteine desulfurase